jgi:phosphoribosylformimino-5-aminoimidazole carboxamide ribotide isomerase
MQRFAVYPAIDLRGGKVVRLSQGDPARQTVYDHEPVSIARQWVTAGASWLHIVNLDGAFGDRGSHNEAALTTILDRVVSPDSTVQVQFGGGMRSLQEMDYVLSLGVQRVILGTVAVEDPDVVGEAVARFGTERVAVGIDTRDNRVRVQGWTRQTAVEPAALGQQLGRLGVRTIIFTNIERDGVGGGADVDAARHLADGSGLEVIVAGGVVSLADVRRARAAGLSGVVIGRALYEGKIDLKEALQC